MITKIKQNNGLVFFFTACLQTGILGPQFEGSSESGAREKSLETRWPGDPGKSAWRLQDSTYFMVWAAAAQT